MMHTITHAQPEPDYRVRLVYATGETIIVDIKPYIERGGIFAALAEPSLFDQVAIGAYGRYIAWPGDIDFCADALWLKGQNAA